MNENENGPNGNNEDISIDTPPSDERTPQVEDDTQDDSIWLRLFFMLVVALLYSVSRVVLCAVVVVQFFIVVLVKEANEPLLSLGQSLASYTYQIIRYLTFNTEERPFPFDSDWPSANDSNQESR